MSDEEKKNTPVIRISIAGAVGDKAQMSFETYVDTETPINVIHGITDKLMLVRDRQVAYYELQDLEKLLEREQSLYDAMKGDLAREDERQARLRSENKGRVEYKLSPKDMQARENIKTNLQVRTNQLEKLKADIEKRRAVVDRKN